MAPPLNTTCHFLDTAPPELRNNVYAFVFVPYQSKNAVELTSASSPSKNLLLTCKQTHAEAKGMYRAAHRGYWSKMQFTVTFPENRKGQSVYHGYLGHSSRKPRD